MGRSVEGISVWLWSEDFLKRAALHVLLMILSCSVVFLVLS